jgi:hypothetical protein
LDKNKLLHKIVIRDSLEADGLVFSARIPALTTSPLFSFVGNP